MRRSADGYDVVIVGAGAGGAAAAWALTTKGVKVLLLEAGPVFDPVTDYRLHLPDWERSGFPVQKARNQARYVYAPMQKLDPQWDDLRRWNAVSGRRNPGGHRKAWRYHGEMCSLRCRLSNTWMELRPQGDYRGGVTSGDGPCSNVFKSEKRSAG